MHTWTSIATTIGDLFTLATAAVNFTAAIQTRPRRGTGRNRHRRSEGSR
jgi:hypothetical protein